MDAVMFGVIPIVYEYEGATIESLISQLDACLQGRNAQYVYTALTGRDKRFPLAMARDGSVLKLL